LQREDPQPADEKLELLLAYLLRAGVILAALISAAGLVLLFVRGTNLELRDKNFHGEPERLRTLHGVLMGALALRPRACMQLGLLILVATPIARVALSVIGFALERDRLYTVITLFVLGLLVAGLLGVLA
jgi:uncharacterized membrane protein